MDKGSFSYSVYMIVHLFLLCIHDCPRIMLMIMLH